METGEYYEAIRLINRIEAEELEVDPAVYYSSCIAYITLDDLPMALESFVKYVKKNKERDKRRKKKTKRKQNKCLLLLFIVYFCRLQKTNHSSDLVTRASLALVRLAIRTNQPSVFEEV